MLIQGSVMNLKIYWILEWYEWCENIDEFNTNKKRKILIAFGDLIADILMKKRRNPIVTELFIRSRKLNGSVIFITQSYFAVPKNIRLNSTKYFLMKIPNKQQLHQIAMNDFSDNVFMNEEALWIFTKNALQINILS